MAYIEVREQLVQSGNKIKKMYRARIRIKGMPEISETFPKKSQATEWARKMEAKIRDERFFPKKDDLERTFGDFIDRYIQNELPKKPKSFSKQKMQLLWWKSHLGSYFLNHITPSLIVETRDKLFVGITRRGKLRSTSTANRYLAALSHAYTIAVKEWGWCNKILHSRLDVQKKAGRAIDFSIKKKLLSYYLLVKKIKALIFILLS